MPVEGRITDVHRALLAGSDAAKTHHVALGSRGGRLIPRNTDAGRAYAKAMKRKGIYVVDCWVHPPPFQGLPRGAKDLRQSWALALFRPFRLEQAPGLQQMHKQINLQ